MGRHQCYRRRANFGGSVVRSMFLIYSPVSPTSAVHEMRSLKGWGRYRGLKVAKSYFWRHFLFTCSDTFAYNTLDTDRQTVGQTTVSCQQQIILQAGVRSAKNCPQKPRYSFSQKLAIMNESLSTFLNTLNKRRWYLHVNTRKIPKNVTVSNTSARDGNLRLSPHTSL